MKEVMQALEELAMSYDTKDKEIDLAYTERDQFKLELETLKVSQLLMVCVMTSYVCIYIRNISHICLSCQ